MIVDIFFGMIQTIVGWIVAPFPTDSLNWLTHLSTIMSNLGAMNYFLPIAETVTVVVAIMALFPIFLGITLSLWVVAQLRGSSSVG